MPKNCVEFYCRSKQNTRRLIYIDMNFCIVHYTTIYKRFPFFTWHEALCLTLTQWSPLPIHQPFATFTFIILYKDLLFTFCNGIKYWTFCGSWNLIQTQLVKCICFRMQNIPLIWTAKCSRSTEEWFDRSSLYKVKNLYISLLKVCSTCKSLKISL